MGEELLEPLHREGTAVEGGAPAALLLEVAVPPAHPVPDPGDEGQPAQGRGQQAGQRPDRSRPPRAAGTVRPAGEPLRGPFPPAVEDLPRRGQDHRGDHGAARRPGDAGEARERSRGEPAPGEDRVQGPGGESHEDRLGVGHRLDERVRGDAPQRDREEGRAGPEDLVRDGVDAPGGQHGGHEGDAPGRPARGQPGHGGHRPDRHGVEREEGQLAGRPALVAHRDHGAGVAVLGDVEVVDGVPARGEDLVQPQPLAVPPERDQADTGQAQGAVQQQRGPGSSPGRAHGTAGVADAAAPCGGAGAFHSLDRAVEAYVCICHAFSRHVPTRRSDLPSEGAVQTT